MTFYITTPIYYVNDTPHIGHAYTTIVADVLSRYHRLFGNKTFFLTGTDEHGQKVEAAAKARGLPPQQHCDEMVKKFEEIWRELDIENDIFMRTTFDYHKKIVQECLQRLFDSGDIYLEKYEGWYSVSEEIFYTEKDLVDGKSPMGKEVTKVSEENYFFRMSKYQQALIEYIENNPEFIRPAGKRSEVLGFLKQPLGDLCISRPKSRLTWGIDLPFNDNFVTYVWFDALLNYATAIGLYQGEKEKQFNELWPHAIHLIGKDILITHTVYWPTMLMALKLPLPKTIFAHGWWLTADNKKMSKSEGPVVTPLSMKDVVGVDGLRYYLVRDTYLGNDAQFSQELVVNRVNSELANNLGNLASRTINLIIKFFDGRIPEGKVTKSGTEELKVSALEIAAKVRKHIEAFEPNLALEEIIQILTLTNRYIDSEAPWSVGKENPALTAEPLYAALEILRIVGILLSPVMPSKSRALLKAIGSEKEPSFEDASKWGLSAPDTILMKPEPLFPRL